MPRQLTAGQRAAVRAAKTRRGELGLTQKELAKAAAVSERTISMFEAEKVWPNPDTLARIERMGLGLVVGHLTEYAARHRQQEPSTIGADIAAILDSNLHPDLKLRLIDQLRSIDTPDEVESGEDETVRPLGEDRKGRETA